MKIYTEQQERYGKARIIARYKTKTDRIIDLKVYDADRHVVLTTDQYEEAHQMLMKGNIKR